MIQEKLNKWGKEKTPFLFLIDFEMQKPLAWPLDAVPDNVFYNFNGATNTPTHKPGRIEQLVFNKNPVSLNDYSLKFNAVQKQLNLGNSFLLNLTVPTPVTTNLDLHAIYLNAQSKYAICVKDQFVSFSPETFVKIKPPFIYTYPMKGTIDANLPQAEQTILNDSKEAAEHATIVDLMRNDLSKVAREVTVTRYRYYEEIQARGKKIGQVSSEIRGKLPEGFYDSLGDLLYSMLPAGSISGAPKQKTVELISAIEAQPRGYYTGVAFYFDGHSLDSCVLIRYIDDKGYFRSGGGITAQSELNSEYQEMIDKVYVPFY